MLVIVNKIILFYFCSLIVAVTMTRRGGIIKMEEDGVRMYGPKLLHATHFPSIFYIVILFFFPFPFLFLNNPGNDSLWFPFLKCGNGFCSFPSCSRNLGWDFSIPFPFPKFGNVFFHSLPVPEFWEWIFSIPFPFPNWPFQSRESTGKMGDFKKC